MRGLAAMMAFGNRWMQDRANVTTVAIMLAARQITNEVRFIGFRLLDCILILRVWVAPRAAFENLRPWEMTNQCTSPVLDLCTRNASCQNSECPD